MRNILVKHGFSLVVRGKEVYILKSFHLDCQNCCIKQYFDELATVNESETYELNFPENTCVALNERKKDLGTLWHTKPKNVRKIFLDIKILKS